MEQGFDGFTIDNSRFTKRRKVMYLLIFILIVLAVLKYLSMRNEQVEDIEYLEDDNSGIIHPAEYCTRW